MNPLLTRLLWLRRSKWQFVLAGFAFLIGMMLMLTTLEAYFKVQNALDAQKQRGEFLVLNKKISIVNTLGLASSGFTDDDIKALRSAPFVKRMSFLTPNQFKASVRAKRYVSLYSMVFFESIDSEFLETQYDEFQWNKGQHTVPIIVSQDFLNLYNFGFALSQGLPQISREGVKLVPFDVVLQGPGGEEVFEGKIVGFTERVSSVLVPKSFMTWANREVGKQKEKSPSRVVIQVNSVSDPQIQTFIKQHRLSADSERMQIGRTGNILNLVMSFVAGLGIVFVSLAFIMFSMNFRLILAEASADIKLLIELGYRHTTIGANLLIYFAAFLGLLFVLASFGIIEANQFMGTLLESQGLAEGSQGLPLVALTSGIIFTLSVIAFNGLLILRQLRNIS